MNFIRGLSSITLVSCLSVSSGTAVAKVTEQVFNPTSSAQTEPMIIANPFRTIREAVQTVDQVNQIRLREQRRQELEAARREATEQQRLEAERRRQYFESLSPQEQQAYLEEQRALRAKADKTAALLLLMLVVGSTGSSDGEVAQPASQADPCEGIPDFNLPTGHPCR